MTENIEVTIPVKVIVDETAFTPEFLAEYRENFYPFETVEDHIRHLAFLAAKEPRMIHIRRRRHSGISSGAYMPMPWWIRLATCAYSTAMIVACVGLLYTMWVTLDPLHCSYCAGPDKSFLLSFASIVSVLLVLAIVCLGGMAWEAIRNGRKGAKNA